MPPESPLGPSVRAFIERQRVARLATLDAGASDAPPHLVPICFALVDDRIYSVVDDKPKRTQQLQRLRNIEAHQNVSLLFDEYDEDWSRLAWAFVRGEAAVLNDGPEHARAIVALRARYRQYATLDGAGRPVIRITPRAARYWRAAEPAPARADFDRRGLNLVRTVERIAAAHVATEYRAGMSSGALRRLHAADDGPGRSIEAHDEAPMPDEGGRLQRFRLADLDDGIYAAESVGPGSAPRLTYFELLNGSVGRLFSSERRARQALRRHE